MSFFEEHFPDVDRYLEEHSTAEPDLLKRLRRETYQKTTQPHMISGYLQGRFLSLFAKISSPKNILEIGTFTGYATLCLAEGLAPEGKITTLDINEELAYLPRKYFRESAYFDQIDFQLKDAKVFLEQSVEFFDFVFIDADKENYVEYFNLAKKRTKSGAVIIFDNVLWYGKVLEENPAQKSTQIIKKLNELVTEDSDFENVILPLRDGLHLIRKK